MPCFKKALIAGVKSSTEKINTLNKLLKQYLQKSSLVQDVNMEIALTYIADEKFMAAVPYLNTLINDAQAGGLKPSAYLKLGLCYYNSDKYDDASGKLPNTCSKIPTIVRSR